MYLTNNEKDILLHRLTVPDAIIDALTDVDDPPFTEEEIGFAIGVLECWIETNEIDLQSECVKTVLEDCIDGSTWLGCAKGNVSPQRLGQIKAEGDRLADKVSKAIGREVRFPNG